MPRPPVERVAFYIRVPEALALRLRATALGLGLSVNASVEHAVFAWLESTDAEREAIALAPKKPKASKPAPDPSVPAHPPASPSREVPTFFKPSPTRRAK